MVRWVARTIFTNVFIFDPAIRANSPLIELFEIG
jgi:hypothetical protein